MKREWLIRYRKIKNLTQEQVSSAAFIDRGYYSQIETGKRNPGVNVAINIANVLEFEPLLFYEESLNSRLFLEKRDSNKIPEHLRMVNKGNILYLYENSDSYYDNLIIFLLTGINNNCSFLIVDSKEKILEVKNSLKSSLFKKDVMNRISFKDADEVENLPIYINNFLKKVNGDKKIRVWTSIKLSYDIYHSNFPQSIEDNNLETNNILTVSAFNAFIVSSEDYIRMMRIYPYLMTDVEFVLSPLFHFEDGSNILPTLYQHKEPKKSGGSNE